MPLGQTVYPQVGPLDPVDGSSQHFYHCALFPWALVSVPALVLDSFLFLLSTSILVTDTSCGSDDGAPLSFYLSFGFCMFFPNFSPLVVLLTNSELAVA